MNKKEKKIKKKILQGKTNMASANKRNYNMYKRKGAEDCGQSPEGKKEMMDITPLFYVLSPECLSFSVHSGV